MAMSKKALDARARRAARRVGLYVKKSRARFGSVENFGEFMLIDPSMNIPLGGFRFDMSAEAVIEYCRG